MSPFDRIRAVLDSDLPKTQCWVLVVYARYDMGDGAWPSMQTVMRETRLSDGAIRKAKRGLVKRGHLAPDGYSYSGTRRYSVSLPEPSTAGRNPVPPPGTRNRSGRNGVPVRAEPSTAKVGREEGRKRETPSYSPKGEDRIERAAAVFLGQMLQYGADGWNADDPSQVQAIAKSCKQQGLTARLTDVEQAIRRARARYEERA